MKRDHADRWLEWGILGVLVGILVYAPLAVGCVHAENFLVVEWLAFALALLWIIRSFLNPSIGSGWPSVSLWLVVFLFYAWARYFGSDIEYVARQECLRVLVYVLIFLVVVQNIRRPLHLRLLSMTLIAVGLFIAIYGVVQYLTGSDLVWQYRRSAVYAGRGSGPFMNPNHMAGYLEMVFPLALVCTVSGRFSVLSRVMIGYAALVMFFGILVSFSRGGWIACAAGLLPLFVWLFGKRVYRWRGVALLIIVVAIGWIFLAKAKMSPNRKSEIVAVSQGDNIRLLIWKPAWQMFLDHAFVGVGPNHFDDRFRQYRPEHRDMQVRPVRVHNDYLNVLVDWGMVGGILVAIPLLVLANQLRRHWKELQLDPSAASAGEAADFSLVLGASLGMITILVHSLFDFNMHVPSNAIAATVLLGIITCHIPRGQAGGTEVSRPWLKAFPIGCVLLGSGYLGWQCVGLTRETIALRQAELHQPCSDNQIAMLKKAFHASPLNHETVYRIGECLRLRSWQSRAGYRDLAEEAISWFDIGARLNPWDPYSPVKRGMCLDWLDQHEEAEASYARAVEVDPNGYYINALMGWHYLQVGDYPRAKHWLDRSLKLFPNRKNFIASYYLGRVHELMRESGPTK